MGKYKDDSSRPLLLKLHRSIDVNIILSGRKSLSSRPDIVIKPDLSPSERKVEQLLLKERRSLINSGVSRGDIKLRGSSLYVKNKKYGSVTNDAFEPLLAEEVPRVPDPLPSSPLPPPQVDSSLPVPAASPSLVESPSLPPVAKVSVPASQQ